MDRKLNRCLNEEKDRWIDAMDMDGLVRSRLKVNILTAKLLLVKISSYLI